MAHGVKMPMQFMLSADCIETLATPTQFYEALLHAVENSTHRLTLASLYLGTGTKEQLLIDRIRRRLHDKPSLRFHGQFDYSRCLRMTKHGHGHGDGQHYPSSADLLLRLYEPYDSSILLHGDGGISSRVSIGLTRMPAVRGRLASMVPQRFIEAGGVWHMKAYVADRHTIILSGANLSADYFTNRQDRYMIIRSREAGVQHGSAGHGAANNSNGDGVAAFAEYLHDLVSTVGRLPGSHVILPSHGPSGVRGTVMMLDEQGQPLAQDKGSDSNSGAQGTGDGQAKGGQSQAAASRITVNAPATDREAALDECFTTALGTVLPSWSTPPASEDLSPSSVPAGKARITPRLQCGPTELRHDEHHTLAVLSDVRPAPADTLHLVTGYFNVTDSIETAMIQAGQGQACVHVLTAAPEANGFYGASGPAGAIPLAYSEMEREFLEQAEAAGRLMPDPTNRPHEAGIAVHEYARPGWTFHGKGMWLERQVAGSGQPAGVGSTDGQTPQAGPGQAGRTGMVTLVGSPNYGVRSADRDLELQACLVTQDPGLVTRLRAERDGLWGRWPAATGTTGQGATVTAAAPQAGKAPRTSLPYIRPVGRHLGPAADVFSHPSRQISGLSWDKGWWIHWGRRVLARFF